MTDPKWIFWGMSAQDLLLAAGQFMLLAASFMLALKHFVWFARLYRYDKKERRRLRIIRSLVELLAAACVAGVYAHAIYLGGPAAEVGDAGSVVRVWAFALLFVALALGRSDGPPPD